MLLQTFLDSLVGDTVEEASDHIRDWGYKSWPLPVGSIVASIAMPDIVILEHDANNIVVSASAGDPCQVVNDT